MNFLLPDEPRPSDLPPLEAPPATFGERFRAERDITGIRLDSWGRGQSHEKDLLDEILEATGTSLDNVPLDSRRMSNAGAVFRYRRDRALAAVAEARASAPDSEIARLPGSVAEFDQAVLNRRKRELEEARAILGRAGEDQWVAELAGGIVGDATDPITLLSLPLGFTPARGLLGVMRSEAIAGATFEALTLDRQVATADELGMDRPDAMTQIGAAALLGAGLGGLAYGGIRGAEWLVARGRGPAPPPPGVSPIDHEIALDDAAEAFLRGEDPALPPRAVAAAAVPDDIVNRIIGVESAGNPNARNAASSAEGLGQFIDSTWLAMLRKHRPDLVEGRTNRELLDLKFDAALNREMTAAYVADNTAYLRERGLPVTPGSIYLAHFAGPEGAARILSAAPNTPLAQVMTRQAIAANRGIRFNGRPFAQMTVGDLQAWATRKMGSTTPIPAGSEVPSFATSRGYTGQGQIRVNDQLRIDVDYEVVDASILRQATGDLQPRDRSRINSDAWVAETAAGLDPALLRPAPTADRGTPIVGPDDVIESGNGRVRAIVRAYERFPDRAAAYRAMIEAETGQPIPEGIAQPVLVARRRTPLDDAQRGQMVIDAQDSGVARMTPTEISRATGRQLTRETLALLRPGVRLADAENAPFVKRALASLPASERNALFDTTGALNAEGRNRLKNALFARAWPDRLLIERYAELEDAGQLKSLLTALETAAPEWAALRADIEAGLVRAEFDIAPFVIDAMRLIAGAREAAARGDGPVAKVLEELLADIDLVEGALPDVTVALVRKFYPEGKPASADDVAEFLSDYARRARDVGQPTMLGEDVGAAELLQSIDGVTFADVTSIPARAAEIDVAPGALPHTYDLGAASAEAEAADAAALEALRGVPPRRPVQAAAASAQPQLAVGDRYGARGVVERVNETDLYRDTSPVRAWEMIRADMAEVGEPVSTGSLFWADTADLALGQAGSTGVVIRARAASLGVEPGAKVGAGEWVSYAKAPKAYEEIVATTAEAAEEFLGAMTPAFRQRFDSLWEASPTASFTRITDADAPAAVWRRRPPVADAQEVARPATGRVETDDAVASLRETADLREGGRALRALDDDIPVDLGDGSTVRVSELLDAAEADLDLADIIDLCKVGGAGA